MLVTLAMCMGLISVPAMAEGDKVAQIGDVQYETLAAAVAAVQSGETITLTADASGSGIIVPESSNFTIDFAGHSYTVDSAPLAGSTGTANQMFQLLKNSTIVMKNGTLIPKSSEIKRIIQNYSNLTLDNMTIDLTNSNCVVGTKDYPLSFNNGTSVIKDSTIKTESTKTAFDVYYWKSGGYPDGARVTIEGTTVIEGAVEFGGDSIDNEDITKHWLKITGGTIDSVTVTTSSADPKGVSITGGTFKTNVSAYVADGYVFENGTVTTKMVAKIGSKEYPTLAEAVAEVPTDGTKTTITMIADETVDVATSPITVAAGKNIVLELNGKTITGNCASGTTSALITNKGTLKIQDSTDTAKNGTGAGKIIAGADPTWTWDGTDNYAGSYASNLIRNEGTLTVENGYLMNVSTGSAAYAIDNYSSGKVTVNGGKLDAAKASAIRMFYNKGGSITVNGGVIGSENSYMGLQVMGTDANNGVSMELNGGTFNGRSDAVYAGGGNAAWTTSSFTINGGTYEERVSFTGAIPATSISIAGGNFNAWVGSWGSAKKFVTGGIFDFNGSRYADQYKENTLGDFPPISKISELGCETEADLTAKGYTFEKHSLDKYKDSYPECEGKYFYDIYYPAIWDLEELKTDYVADGYVAKALGNNRYEVVKATAQNLENLVIDEDSNKDATTVAIEEVGADLTATENTATVVTAQQKTAGKEFNIVTVTKTGDENPTATAKTIAVTPKATTIDEVTNTIAVDNIDLETLGVLFAQKVDDFDNTTPTAELSLSITEKVEETTGTSVTYDVHPEVKIGSETYPLEGPVVDGSYTFKLPVANSFVTETRKTVKVTYEDEDPVYLPVKGESGNYYVEVTVTHFSDATVEPAEDVVISDVDAFVHSTSGLGNIRFITTVNSNGTVTEYGTYFVLADNITNIQQSEANVIGTTEGQKTTFSADIRNIEGNLDTSIYAMSFIKVGSNDAVWSDFKIASVNEYDHNKGVNE